MRISMPVVITNATTAVHLIKCSTSLNPPILNGIVILLDFKCRNCQCLTQNLRYKASVTSRVLVVCLHISRLVCPIVHRRFWTYQPACHNDNRTLSHLEIELHQVPACLCSTASRVSVHAGSSTVLQSISLIELLSGFSSHPIFHQFFRLYHLSSVSNAIGVLCAEMTCNISSSSRMTDALRFLAQFFRCGNAIPGKSLLAALGYCSCPCMDHSANLCFTLERTF